MGPSDGGQMIAGPGQAGGRPGCSARWQVWAAEFERHRARIAGRDLPIVLRVELPRVARLNRAVEDNFAICGDFRIGGFTGLKLES
jgi:hypothetical protein